MTGQRIFARCKALQSVETADKIVVLVDGEVRTIGTKDEIMPVLMEASRVCSRLADKV